jgi:6-phosphogluconolactonase
MAGIEKVQGQGKNSAGNGSKYPLSLRARTIHLNMPRMNFSPRTTIIWSLTFLMLTTTLRAKEFFVYFGTYTEGSSKGIYVSRLDSATGQLSEPELAATTPDPSFLAISPDKKNLYAANEIGGQKSGTVSAFTIDKASGRLELLGQEDSGGLSPCHVSVDAHGKTLLVANYNSGTVKSIPLLSGGGLGGGGSLVEYQGHGPNANRQTSPHAHFLAVDPSGHFALGCDLGTDRVMIYRLNPGDATLVANNPPFAVVPPGSGPRHLAFSRDGKYAYVLNEMGCSISLFYWDAKQGLLTADDTIPALPDGVAVQPNYTSAEILVRPDGKFVYATIRGHDSISVFAVDGKTRRLTLIQNISARGQVPRGLGIDPTGHWLVVANQKSGNVVEFGIDKATGKLTPTQTEFPVGSPVDVKFVKAG